MSKKSLWDNTSLQQDIKWDNQELPGIPDEVLLTKNWNQISAVKEHNKHVWQDPIKRQQLLEKRKQITQTQEYKNNVKNGHKLSLTNPELIKKFSEKSKEVWSDLNKRQQVSNTLKEKWHEDSFKEKMSKRKHRNGKRIHTPWGDFDSRTEALIKMKKLGIKNRGNTLDNGLKTKPNLFWIIGDKDK